MTKITGAAGSVRLTVRFFAAAQDAVGGGFLVEGGDARHHGLELGAAVGGLGLWGACSEEQCCAHAADGGVDGLRRLACRHHTARRRPFTPDERRRQAAAELRKTMRREMEQRFSAIH
jgi:hypothetical protein